MAKQVKEEKNDSFNNDENNIKCGEIMFANNSKFCFSCTFCQKHCDKLQDFFRHVLFDHLNYLDEYEFEDEEVIKHIESDGTEEISKLTKKNNSFGYNFDKFISNRIADAVSIKSEGDDNDEDEGNYQDDIEEIEFFEESILPGPEKKRSTKSGYNDMLHIEFLEEPSENEYEPECTEFAEAYSIKNDSQDEQDPDAEEDIVEIELNNMTTQYSNESEDEENRPSPPVKKVIHKKGNDYKCAFPDCKRSFLTKTGAKRHFQNVHTTANRITCETCFKTFSTKYTYEKHNMLRHLGLRPHPCDICGQSFSDKSNLKVHIMRHKGIKPHECSVCEKRFHSSTELKLHMRTHTGERPFVCEVCGRKFSNSGHLCNHRRRHFGERPYECNVCQKKFFDRKLLNDHAIMHTTERPFECVTCSATFQRKKALMQHEKLHSGTKQYVCKLCGKSFAQNAGLYSHMKSH